MNQASTITKMDTSKCKTGYRRLSSDEIDTPSKTLPTENFWKSHTWEMTGGFCAGIGASMATAFAAPISLVGILTATVLGSGFIAKGTKVNLIQHKTDNPDHPPSASMKKSTLAALCGLALGGTTVAGLVTLIGLTGVPILGIAILSSVPLWLFAMMPIVIGLFIGYLSVRTVNPPPPYQVESPPPYDEI